MAEEDRSDDEGALGAEGGGRSSVFRGRSEVSLDPSAWIEMEGAASEASFGTRVRPVTVMIVVMVIVIAIVTVTVIVVVIRIVIALTSGTGPSDPSEFGREPPDEDADHLDELPGVQASLGTAGGRAGRAISEGSFDPSEWEGGGNSDAAGEAAGEEFLSRLLLFLLSYCY